MLGNILQTVMVNEWNWGCLFFALFFILSFTTSAVLSAVLEWERLLFAANLLISSAVFRLSVYLYPDALVNELLEWS